MVSTFNEIIHYYRIEFYTTRNIEEKEEKKVEKRNQCTCVLFTDGEPFTLETSILKRYLVKIFSIEFPIKKAKQ